MLTSTSTRLFGWISPLTPATSLILTPIARLPGVILTSIPGPVPEGARRPGTRASPSNTATRVTRPISESGDEKAPAGIVATGHSRTVSAVRSMLLPSARFFAATTRGRVAIRLAAFVVSRTRYTPKVATAAMAIAT